MENGKFYLSNRWLSVAVILLFSFLIVHMSRLNREGVIVYIGCDKEKTVKLSPGVYTDAEHLPGLGLRVYKKKNQKMQMKIPKGWTVKIYDHEEPTAGKVLVSMKDSFCHDLSKIAGDIASLVVEDPSTNVFLE